MIGKSLRAASASWRSSDAGRFGTSDSRWRVTAPMTIGSLPLMREGARRSARAAPGFARGLGLVLVDVLDVRLADEEVRRVVAVQLDHVAVVILDPPADFLVADQTHDHRGARLHVLVEVMGFGAR